jgi:MFS transporter, SP family, xylose:H+ symportor
MTRDPTSYWAAAVATAGLLFGFDTAVISGADQPLQALWHSSDLFHGLFVMSSALWGTVLGALLGNLPCERFGRRATLFATGALYLVSALGSALAPDPVTFSLFRFIGGVGVGLSSIVVPVYIAEIAPAERRGRLVALYQFLLVLGILLAYCSNYLLAEYAGAGWRWMLGVEVFPAALFLLLLFAIPESPRWMMLRLGDESGARRILEASIQPDVETMLARIRSAESEAGSRGKLFARPHTLPIVLAFLVAFFNQASGINFVIYFAPRIFSMAGLDDRAALLSTAGIGAVNLVFTMLGLSLIDRYGRRLLLLIGSIGYIVSLSMVAWAFHARASGMVVVPFVFLFIAAHAVGQGAVIWVFIAEIFPNSIRAKGQSLGSGTHWVAAATLTLLIPYFLGRYAPAGIFSFFAVMMALQFAFVLFLVPETRGRSLETLAVDLQRSGRNTARNSA